MTLKQSCGLQVHFTKNGTYPVVYFTTANDRKIVMEFLTSHLDIVSDFTSLGIELKTSRADSDVFNHVTNGPEKTHKTKDLILPVKNNGKNAKSIA